MPLHWAILGAAGEAKRLPCAAAFDICASQSATPAQVRDAADALGVRLTDCQLGLFGRGHDQHPLPAPSASMLEAMAPHSGAPITCEEAWRIADLLGESRFAAGAAANSVGVKISVCQLGCF